MKSCDAAIANDKNDVLLLRSINDRTKIMEKKKKKKIPGVK